MKKLINEKRHSKKSMSTLVFLFIAALFTCGDGRWDTIRENISVAEPIIGEFTLTSGTPTTEPDITFTLNGRDNGEITGWLVKESAETPDIDESDWTADTPEGYTLSGTFGEYTVYAWAKDDDGNISDPKSIVVQYYDGISPVITDFSRTSASPTTDPDITFTLDGTDNVAITHWLINEFSAIPSAGDPGWSAAKPSDYTITGDYGIVSVYAWAKDDEDNINTPKSITVDYRDGIPPVLSDFSRTSASPTTDPDITFTLDGTDNVAITHWLINESSAIPLAGDPGWSAAKPADYTISGYGGHTLYAWVKDARDNISNSLNFSVELQREQVWTKRIKFSVARADVGANSLTDFPVYINLAGLDANTEFFTDVQADGKDIVVTDCGTETLRRELVNFDKGGKTGQLWFKAPQLNGTGEASDSEFCVAFGYGSSYEGNSTDVWSNDYVAVWHFEESGDGTADEYMDSSPFGNHGTGGGGTMTVPFLTASGKLGGAQDYTEFGVGVNDTDGITIPASASISNLGPLTVNWWMKFETTDVYDNNDRVFNKGPWNIRIHNSSTKMPFQLQFYDDPEPANNFINKESTCVPAKDGNWYYRTVNWDATNNGGLPLIWPSTAVKFYKNSGITLVEHAGVASTHDGQGQREDDSASNLIIGNSSGMTSGYTGIFDEIHIANVSRSLDWMTVEFKTQNHDTAAFYSISCGDGGGSDGYDADPNRCQQIVGGY